MLLHHDLRPPDPDQQQNNSHQEINDENVAPPDTSGEDDELALWLASLQLDHYLPTFTAAALDLTVIQYVKNICVLVEVHNQRRSPLPCVPSQVAR